MSGKRACAEWFDVVREVISLTHIASARFSHHCPKKCQLDGGVGFFSSRGQQPFAAAMMAAGWWERNSRPFIRLSDYLI